MDTTKLPALIFLQDGIPETYEGDLEVSSEIFDWIKIEVTSDEIEIVSREMLEKLIRSGNSIAASAESNSFRYVDRCLFLV